MVTSRRQLLKSTTGVVLGVTIANQSSSATQARNERNVRVHQGEYLKKHAVRRQSLYEMMVPVFDPPDTDDFFAKFVESLAPSASSLLPGIAGSAADLKETLEWFDETQEMKEFREVARQGVQKGIDEQEGEFGDGMEGARDELQELKSAASAVEEAASSYEQDPTEENKEALIQRIQHEHELSRDTYWITGWSEIHPNLYHTAFRDLEGAAEKVRDNADAVTTVLTAIVEETENQATTLERNGVLRIPDMIVTYGERIDEVRQNVPGFAFSRYAGDSLNIRIQNDDGEDLTVTWINTNSKGEIEEYVLNEKSADAEFMIPDSSVERIRDSENPNKALSEAWENDEITLKGNGFVNGMKYNHTDLIEGIFDALS